MLPSPHLLGSVRHTKRRNLLAAPDGKLLLSDSFGPEGKARRPLFIHFDATKTETADRMLWAAVFVLYLQNIKWGNGDIGTDIVSTSESMR